MLTDYVERRKVLLNLEATDFKETLHRMVAVSDRKDDTKLVAKILKREELMPTTLGKSVALPRAVVDDNAKTEIILAISPQGIKASSVDNLPIKIVMLFLFAKREKYASILAQGMGLVNDENARVDLLQAKDEERVIEIVRMWESE